MNKVNKIEYLKMDSKAYYSGCEIVAKINLKDIEYNVNDYAIITFEPYSHNYTNNAHFGKSVHRLKINYDTQTPFIKFLGYRLKLNQFIKYN